MTDISRLSVELVARLDGFEPNLRKADAALAKTAASMTTKVDALDGRLAKLGGNRLMGLQQAGYQIGDFAVQIASGGNALTAFIQQGTQIAGAFGPWGAVVGAAGAVVGALTVALLDSKEAAEELDLDIGGLEGGVDGLESVVRDYADSIKSTSVAQAEATGVIVAETRREFDAKKKLLELELKRQQAVQAERRARIASVEADLAPPPLFVTNSLSARDQRSAQITNESRMAAFEERAPALRDELQKLQADAELTEISIGKTTEAIGTSFDEMLAKVTSEDGGRGGGSRSRIDKIATAMENVRDRLEKMAESARNSAEAVGLSGEALARHNAAVEVAALKQDLLNKARDEGRALTDSEIKDLDRLGAAYIDAAVASDRLKEAEDDRTEAARESAKAGDDLADAFSSSITQAESAEDAIRRLTLALVELGLEWAKLALLEGKGPFAAGGSGGGAPGWFGFLGTAISAAVGGLAGGVSSPYSGYSTADLASQYASYGAGRIVPRASGGPVSAGMPYFVNEHLHGGRPTELFVPSMSGAVLSVPQAQAAMQARGGGAGGGEVDVRVYVDRDGNWRGEVARISGGVAAKTYDRREPGTLRAVERGVASPGSGIDYALGSRGTRRSKLS